MYSTAFQAKAFLSIVLQLGVDCLHSRLKINLIAPLTLTSPVSINVPTRSAFLVLAARLILFHPLYL